MKKILMSKLQLIIIFYININLLILFITPNIALSYEFNTYSTENNPKSCGLDIVVKYPEFYKSLEGDRPHVVRKFNYKDGDILNSMMIIIRDIDRNEFKEILKYSNSDLIKLIKSFFEGSNININNIYNTEIEGERSVVVDGSTEAKRINLTMYGELIHSIIFYDNRLIDLQCSSTGVLKDNNANVNDKKSIKEYWNKKGKQACLEYINSINIMNKYR